MLSILRVVGWSLGIAGLCFAVGFVGPMILAPGANQGPLLGIFITGPLGLIVGLVVGVVRELCGFTAGPMEVLARTGFGDARLAGARGLLRLLSAIVGVLLAKYAIEQGATGVTRGVAACVVVSAACLYHAVTGRDPTWLRR